jgi:hypothetical protein
VTEYGGPKQELRRSDKKIRAVEIWKRVKKEDEELYFYIDTVEDISIALEICSFYPDYCIKKLLKGEKGGR